MKKDYELELEHGYDPAIEDHVSKMIQESTERAKAVWEIDGVTIYVSDIKLENNNMSVDWFTFDNTIDRGEMNAKVETLAKKLIGEKCSSTLFSRICYTMKNIFATSGRT